jgi:hypothetical protein
MTIVPEANGYPVSGIKLRDGSILVAWSTGASDYDNSASILGSISTDGGYSWSDSFILVKNRGKRLTEQQFMYSGENLYEIYSEINESGNESAWLSTLYMRESLDGGAYNWSDDVEISNWSSLFTITSNPIQLKSGRWIFPVQYITTSSNFSHYYSSVFYTDNFTGLSTKWLRGGIADNPNIPTNEMSIVQTDDGNITGLLRYNGYHFLQTFSDDGGATWTVPRYSNIPSSDARPHIMRLSDGNIVLAWNDVSDSSPRTPLSIAILNTSATGLVSVTNLTLETQTEEYQNMGIIDLSNGDFLAVTDESRIGYKQTCQPTHLPMGIYGGWCNPLGIAAYRANAKLIGHESDIIQYTTANEFMGITTPPITGIL